MAEGRRGISLAMSRKRNSPPARAVATVLIRLIMVVAGVLLVVSLLFLQHLFSVSVSPLQSIPETKPKNPWNFVAAAHSAPVRIFAPDRDWVKEIDSPMGTFIFRETKACAPASSSCQIHFPSDAKDHNLLCDMNGSTLSSSSLCLRTQKGFKPPMGPEEEILASATAGGVPNQDRALLLQPLALETAQGTIETDCMLLLLADGHGPAGHVTAAAVQKFLPLHILKLLQVAGDKNRDPDAFRKDVPTILKQAFLECDQKLIANSAEKSGSTVVVVLKVGSTLYIASLGDSTASLLLWNNNKPTPQQQPHCQVVATAVPHKPHMPEERKRIEGLGGQVYMPFSLQEESSRVLLPGGLALAMSRSMGDVEGKIPGWLLAEPTVLTVPLKDDQEYFVVVASDGVTDYHPFLQVAEKAGTALFGGTSSLGKAVDSILKESEEGWFKVSNGEYRDDMTIVLSRISATNPVH